MDSPSSSQPVDAETHIRVTADDVNVIGCQIANQHNVATSPASDMTMHYYKDIDNYFQYNL